MSAFHFLRPEWLLALPAAAALLWVVSQRTDVRSQWRGTIAPHLLDHLVVDRRASHWLRPVHLTVALIVLGGIAAAGPTWERERSPFVEDKAPLAIAIDLSPTMDAIDVAPTRLERAKLKIRDLLALRSGARTAIFAYAGSAHMVLPLTDDAGLLETYVDSLATSIMPLPGKDTAKALGVVEAALAREATPGTILFITDGVEPGAIAAFKEHKSHNEIMVLGVGTTEGGPVKTGQDAFLTDATGRRVFAKLDAAALRTLKTDANVQVATVTADDADVQWIGRRVQTHLERQQADAQDRWRDFGWYLVTPIVILGALWFRRGWTIRWTAATLLLTLLLSNHARAAEAATDGWVVSLERVFFTRDQLGRLAFERGDYVLAAARFEDPMWRGVALYRAGRYEDAVQAFALIDTAESYYNQGNALAQAGKLRAAVASYQEALARRPEYADAKANLELVRKLIPPDQKDDEEQAQDPNQKPDQIQFDEKGKKGKAGEVELGTQTAEMWMRNIQTTPAQLLQRKFALELQRTGK